VREVVVHLTGYTPRLSERSPDYDRDVKIITHDEVPGWLLSGDGHDFLLGCDAAPFADPNARAAWIFHACYETPPLAPRDPVIVPFKTQALPDGWHRVRFRELARRHRLPLPDSPEIPELLRFTEVVSEGLAGPDEASMDPESFARLVELLEEHCEEGAATPCCALYGEFGIPHGVHDSTLGLFECRLGDLWSAYDNEYFGPANIWDEAGTFLVFTSWDLMTTKVSGPDALIEAILADDVLEAIPA
jgi:hypothetical protein